MDEEREQIIELKGMLHQAQTDLSKAREARDAALAQIEALKDELDDAMHERDALVARAEKAEALVVVDRELRARFDAIKAERDAALAHVEALKKEQSAAVRWAEQYQAEAHALRAQVEALKEAGANAETWTRKARVRIEAEPKDAGPGYHQETKMQLDAAVAAWRKAVDASAGDGPDPRLTAVVELKERMSEAARRPDPPPDTIAGVPIKDTLAPLPEEFKR